MEFRNDIVEKLLIEYDTDLIYNQPLDETHAEVFDKHPITAMSEFEPNNVDRILIITDSWKPEWCREGVQVPVKSEDEQKKPEINYLNYRPEKSKKFVMPDKLIRSTQKYDFDPNKHYKMPESFEYLYEIDPIDASWIEVSNIERNCLGLQPITESMIEIVFEILERICYKRIHVKVREAETEFLEHDENSKCDVCQSPEGEDGNELVFCEDCFVCVHQACYGIPELPSGSWICRHCDKCPNESSKCLLCPNRGGAMKQIDTDEDKWVHLSCAVWIPEVGFGNIDLMEPVTRIATIPQARWNLRCHLCKTSNTGAPIQCSEKKCKLAFHVTCAIHHGLVMKQEFQINMDVKLLAYCKIHSKKYMEPNSVEPSVAMGPRDIKELRIQKQKEFEKTFHEFVSSRDLSGADNSLIDLPKQLTGPLRKISADAQDKIFTYWSLKRTSNHYQCLIRPPAIWSEEHQKQRFTNRSVFNAFCKIRYGLDRARLMLSMLVRREKQKRHLFSVMSEISELQLAQFKRCCGSSGNAASDPSLEPHWGFISTVHLDNSIYVNPGRLIDVNLEHALRRLHLKKPDLVSADTLSAVINDNSPSVSFGTPGVKKRKYVRKQIQAQPPQPSKLETPSDDRQGPPKSCVLEIPDSQLVMPSDVKQSIYSRLRQPVFVCNYLELPPDYQDIAIATVLERDDLGLAADLPDDSDSSYIVLSPIQSAESSDMHDRVLTIDLISGDQDDSDDCKFDPPRHSQQSVPPVASSSRNIFDEFNAETTGCRRF